MFIHYTLFKVMPEKVQEAAEVLAGSKLLDYFLKAKGLHHGSLSESVEEAGKLLSLSMWDSPADAQAVFADPNYGALVGELRSLLIAPPGRVPHTLLQAQTSKGLPAANNNFINTTVLTVAPENTQKLMAILYSDKIIALTESTGGFVMGYAFESMDEPGRIVSMTWWTSPAEAQAGFSQPEYAALLGDMRPLLIKAPERQGFKVLRIVRHDG